MKGSMKAYIDAYKDFHISDGTFSTNKYGYTLVPHVIVDGLGKTILAGFTLSLTENSADICRGLKLLSLDKESSTFMTDGGKLI